MTPTGPTRIEEGGTVPPDRQEFATPEWFAMLGAVLTDLAQDHDGADGGGSFSELYCDVPPKVAGHEGPVGWSVSFESGKVCYQAAPVRTADIVIEVDYRFARDMLQEYDPADEAARQERRSAVAAARAAGMFRAQGDLSRSPLPLRHLHDALAARTVQR